jgi:hypothetical protein
MAIRDALVSALRKKMLNLLGLRRPTAGSLGLRPPQKSERSRGEAHVVKSESIRLRAYDFPQIQRVVTVQGEERAGKFGGGIEGSNSRTAEWWRWHSSHVISVKIASGCTAPICSK